MISSLRKAVLWGEARDGHKGTVRQVACSPDGNLACSASGDHTCIVWDVSDGKFSRKCSLGTIPTGLTGGGQGTGHVHIVTGVAFSPGGKYIATVSYDKSVRAGMEQLGGRARSDVR
ncbi:WD40-repeat-containing domain protein [Baffinella frigidus]|nr:WD40-repeat-containing domain protein [Cryptophyta sp. CCMP2293]